MASRFELQTIKMQDGSRKFSLRIRSNVSQKHKGDIILPQSRVFDALYSSHHVVAHQKVAATHSCCRKIFWNVTQQQCSVFIETCHACVSEKPRTLTMKGSVTPIRSARYRDRMQVNLNEIWTCRRKNPFGLLMQYIVVCKDHFTGFMAAACIPRKRASYVGYVLTDIFGHFGFPRILHTDNGKEFIGKPVLDMKRENSPFCSTVTGHHRTPRDQGSVENMNYH
jgi:hypothetical protein